MTEYRLAQSDMQYAEGALLAGIDKDGFMFPTLLAYRGNEVVGVLGTQNRQDAVIAGPLAVAHYIPNKGFIASKLVDYYEQVMARLGMVEYLFHVAEDNKLMRRAAKDLPYKHIASTEEGHWFKRVL